LFCLHFFSFSPNPHVDQKPKPDSGSGSSGSGSGSPRALAQKFSGDRLDQKAEVSRTLDDEEEGVWSHHLSSPAH